MKVFYHESSLRLEVPVAPAASSSATICEWSFYAAYSVVLCFQSVDKIIQSTDYQLVIQNRLL